MHKMYNLSSNYEKDWERRRLPHVKDVYKGKNWFLLFILARASGVQNAERIIRYFSDGLRVAGDVEPSGLFKTLDENTIRKFKNDVDEAKLRQKEDEWRGRKKLFQQQCPQWMLNDPVTIQRMEETFEKKILDKYKCIIEISVEEALLYDFDPVLIFPVLQGERVWRDGKWFFLKVRPCSDFKRLNQSVLVLEKLKFGGIKAVNLLLGRVILGSNFRPPPNKQELLEQFQQERLDALNFRGTKIPSPPTKEQVILHTNRKVEEQSTQIIPEIVKIDFTGYYSQLACRDWEKNTACFFSMKKNDWRIFKVPVMAFGSIHAIYDAVVLSKILEIVILKFFRIPVTIYIDDTIIITANGMSNFAEKTLLLFFSLIGLEVAPEKTESSLRQQWITVLGFDYKPIPNAVKCRIPPSKTFFTCKLIDDALIILKTGKCVCLKELQKINGNLVHINQIFDVALGAWLVKALASWTTETQKECKRKQKGKLAKIFLSETLKDIRNWITNIKPTLKGNYKEEMKKSFIYTDAALEGPEGAKRPAVGGVELDEDCKVICAWKIWNPEIIPILETAGIFLWEMLAVWQHFKSKIEKTSSNLIVTIFTDNSAVWNVLRKGYSGDPLATVLIRDIRSICAQQCVFIEARYVNTKRNTADMLTRRDLFSNLEKDLINKFAVEVEESKLCCLKEVQNKTFIVTDRFGLHNTHLDNSCNLLCTQLRRLREGQIDWQPLNIDSSVEEVDEWKKWLRS